MSEHTNKLDNSEFTTGSSTHDFTPAVQSLKEVDELTAYMKMLKMRAEIEADDRLKTIVRTQVWDPTANSGKGKWDFKDKQVLVKDLLPQDSEFEKTRKLILISLNKLGAESETFRKYASRFSTNSIFELSSRIANYVLDEKRRRETYNDLIDTALSA